MPVGPVPVALREHRAVDLGRDTSAPRRPCSGRAAGARRSAGSRGRCLSWLGDIAGGLRGRIMRASLPSLPALGARAYAERAAIVLVAPACLRKSSRISAATSLGRRRPAEVEALHLVAAEIAGVVGVARGLDALDADAHARARGRAWRWRSTILRAGASGAVEGAHETAVDLDLVERKAPQVVEARVAGAEVVHDDAGRRGAFSLRSSLSTRRASLTSTLSVISISNRSGARPEAASASSTSSDDAAGAELGDRQVDRNRQVRRATSRPSSRPRAAPTRRAGGSRRCARRP